MQITAPGLELPSILAKEFSVSSRNRGDEYFRLKRVKVHIGSSAEVSATVNGMEPYEVLHLPVFSGRGSELQAYLGFDSDRR